MLKEKCFLLTQKKKSKTINIKSLSPDRFLTEKCLSKISKISKISSIRNNESTDNDNYTSSEFIFAKNKVIKTHFSF